MADDFGDKTEAPTPRRLTEARKQGNIARSPDLSAALLLLAILVMLKWWGPGIFGAMRAITEQLLGGDWLAHGKPSDAVAQLLLCVRVIASAMAPLLLGAMLIAIVANLLQVGFFLNVQRLQPNPAALNPFKGIKKFLNGRDNLVKMGMNVLKLVLIGLVSYSAIRGKISLILSTQQLSFFQIFGLGTEIVYSIGMRISVVLLILALIDYAWQKWRTMSELKMSKYEVKEEMRRMEGDPKIKQRRRQVAIQRIVQSARKTVPTADVIVTNPDHFSVALKYDAATMTAPKVVAKGVDVVAFQIRRIAIEHGIPILERPPLARALYRLVDVGQEIPEQFYSAVAEILAYVYELSGKQPDRELAAT